jgi:hypothetical protein
LPDVEEGDKPAKQKFKSYPIGFFHIDIAEVQTALGKLYLFVGIDLTRNARHGAAARRADSTQDTVPLHLSRGIFLSVTLGASLFN